MKKILLITAVVSLAACAAAGPKFPGKSLADARLQRDAAQSVYAVALANSDNKGCKDVEVVSTMLDPGKPEQYWMETAQKTGWSEVWVVRVCKEMVGMNMQFMPDGRGGTYFKGSLMKKRGKNDQN